MHKIHVYGIGNALATYIMNPKCFGINPKFFAKDFIDECEIQEILK